MLPIGGKFEFDDGGFYCGGWSDGKAHGHGVCSGPQGQGRYDGLWDFGFETSGTYTWPSGNLYAGEWTSGKRHGLGEELKGRWIYRGDWTHGFKGRYGVRQSTSSGACYAGTWTTGLQDGYGVETYVDGGTYRGQWLQSMRHGFGVRQSAPYALAVRYRNKSTTSKSSMTTSSDQEDNATLRRRDERIDNERGGFVLLGRNEQRRAALLESSSEGKLRRTLGRLKKQRSTSDIVSIQLKRSPGTLRHHIRNQRACSEEMDDRNTSFQTDSCNASFISQDEIRHGASVDIEVIETYSGEWKNDKRSGFGVCERTDGLKYEGEWFNNKKNGYGITTFPDGTSEEGKYKENELVASMTEASTHHLFAIKQSRLREHVNSAIRQALHATQIAHQKADIASARQSNAKLKADHAEITASKARTDAELARQMAAQCENTPLQFELLQSMLNANGKANSTGTDANAENANGERRQSKSMSIFAKAFGKCSDSRRPSTVAAVFHAATSTLRQTPARLSRRLSSLTVDNNSLAKKLQVSNNVTWKTSRERMSSESPERDVSMSNRQWTSNEARSNHVAHRVPEMRSRHHPTSSVEIDDRDFSRRRLNNTAATSESSFAQDGATSRHTRMPSQSRLSSDEEEEHHRMLRQRHQQQGSGQTPNSYDSRLIQEEVDLDSEERDYCSPTLSAGNRNHHRSRSRSSSRGPDGVSRRLTLPSIIKQGVPTPNEVCGSSGSEGKTDGSSHGQQNGKSYVIINDQGKRLAVSASRSRGQLSASPEKFSGLPVSSSDSSIQDLPSRYTLVPLPAAGERGRAGRSRSRGSLPDVSASVVPAAASGFMSREEVHLLSQNKREELRLLREEAERRRKFELILNVGSLREWSSQRQLLIFVVAINVSLAAVFWNLLRQS